VRISVEREVCYRHARCIAHCPEVFGVDDEGYAVVLVEDVPCALRPRALEAVRRCPEGAIHVSPPAE
jgi:ferredoxin